MDSTEISERQRWIGLIAVVGLVIVIGALILTGPGAINNPGQSADEMAWTEMQLTDVRTGESFTISDFDQPVIVETFAVWCTTCTRQQQEIQTLHDETDDIVSVTLNIDPNEDAAAVRDHVNRHSFDWRYAVAPAEMTQDLVETFGRSITVAPRAPMVVVCPGGTVKRLQDGVKPADTIRSAVEETCR